MWFFTRIIARHQVHELFRCCIAGVGAKIFAQRVQALEEERRQQLQRVIEEEREQELQRLKEEDDERTRVKLQESKAEEGLAIPGLSYEEEEATPQEQELQSGAVDEQVDLVPEHEEQSPAGEHRPETESSDKTSQSEVPVERPIMTPKDLRIEGTTLVQETVIDGTPVWLKIKVGTDNLASNIHLYIVCLPHMAI
jgi:hypothetical protein